MPRKKRKPGALATVPCSKKRKKAIKISEIKIISIKFSSHHGLIKNYNTDYKNKGKLYPDIHWTPGESHPISHSTGVSISMDIEIEVGPTGADTEEGDLICTWGGKELFRNEDMRFIPGIDTHRITSNIVTKTIAKGFYTLAWQTERTVAISPASTTHEILFTLGVPSAPEEPGITYKRMFKSIELVKPFNSTVPHTIVSKLMEELPEYTLQPDKAVPAKYHHADYFNKEGGAWPMMDYMDNTGECQAIVRFVTGVIKQVGVPGDAETVFISVNPATPDVALETTDGTSYNGYALVDSPVSVRDIGKVFPPSHTELPGGDVSMGLNNFEACLKFGEGGTIKYYGGGAGVYNSSQEVLRKAFYALVKYESVWYYPNAPDKRKKVLGFKILKILARKSNW